MPKKNPFFWKKINCDGKNGALWMSKLKIKH